MRKSFVLYRICWSLSPYSLVSCLGEMHKFLWILALFLCVNYSLSSCPHERFLAKHVCNHCSSEEAALQFSRNRPDPGPVNTVLVLDGGQQPAYVSAYRRDREICLAEEANVAAVWQCRTDRGYCSKQQENQRCTIHHAADNGHFFYNWMTC